MKTLLFIIAGALATLLVVLRAYWKYQAHQAYFKNERIPDDCVGTMNNQASNFLDSANYKN